MAKIRAFAAAGPRDSLKPIEYDPGPLRSDQVEIAVRYCGICHSDLSMVRNEWGMTTYPIIPGHEIVGTISAVGSEVKHLKTGQTVGLGWMAGSDRTCRQCLAGDFNLCPAAEQTIVGRPGGFAERVRCQALWAIPLPDELDQAKAGPLFCGGITVFNPVVQFDIKPTDRVGVVGIGGLGHLALQFLNKWGCEVVAFTSSDSKKKEAMDLGAHRVVNSRDDKQVSSIRGSLDFIISTVNVSLPWQAYLDSLAPKGRLHFVGAVGEPVPVPVFSLLMGQKSVSGSPLGSPATIAKMLDFCGRHEIAAVTEMFPMSRVNEALAHLESGKARYRIVLENDFK